MKEKVNFVLSQILINHCKCYKKECEVSGTHPLISDFLKEIFETNEKRMQGNDGACNIIYDSKSNSSDSLNDLKVYLYDIFNVFEQLHLLKITDLDELKYQIGYEYEDVEEATYDYSLDDSFDTLSNVPALCLSTVTGNTFSWETVQSIKSAEVPTKIQDLAFEITKEVGHADDLYKILFWFFRKAVVDTLIILENHIADREITDSCLALSVGSIKITSDYDITLYGDCAHLLASKFRKKIKNIFGDSSDVVFDTNVYSSSFINLLTPDENKKLWYNPIVCNAKLNLWHIKWNDKIRKEQNIWAGIKLVKVINELNFGKAIGMSKVYTKINDILERLTSIVQIYDPSMYGFMTSNKNNSLSEFINDISIINFMSKETYFTMGAFFDIVVNGQLFSGFPCMCLCESQYIDSFIENCADYCLHHGEKKKYMERAMNASKNFNQVISLIPIMTIPDILNVAWKTFLNIVDFESIETISKHIQKIERSPFFSRRNTLRLESSMSDLSNL